MNVASTVATYTSNKSFGFLHKNTNTMSRGTYQPRAEDFVGSFYAVLNRWNSETKFLSDPVQKTAHQSYKALVANAGKVLPLIKMELEKNPSHLIWVLEDFFGKDPYGPGDDGDVRKQTNRWLAYLESDG